tara:strand:- start:955 stop:1467 length:513 start_codon:yes stop_codon:yes gene_type:complete
MVNKNKIADNNSENKLTSKSTIVETKGNLIENIFYLSEDNRGQKYEIFAETGNINENKPNLIKMLNVEGIITLSNKKRVRIISKRALYNNKTYHTIFEENVVLLYQDNKVTGEKLELEFEKNKIFMSENVKFFNPNSHMFADRVEVDLITKASKIFMDNTNEKILAKYWE